MNSLIILYKKCVSARHDSEIWLYTAEKGNSKVMEQGENKLPKQLEVSSALIALSFKLLNKEN